MTDETTVIRPIRLAFRVEGSWWVAYLAQVDTMEGAVEMGRILVTASQTVVVHEGFKALMRQVLTEQLGAIGVPPLSWEETTGPASERPGAPS